MPPLPGETLLITLFADVHYYISAPSAKPLHDRFDRGSYVYLYHNATQRRARIEVANAAGTPDQDAFHGYLDSVLVKHRYQQPNLLSVTPDSFSSRSPSGQSEQSQWRLPAYDLKNEQKYLYKLQGLDLYFWTASDASRFLDSLKRLLPQHQLDVLESPSAMEHRDSMSPVVEKLENAAIHDSPQVFSPNTFPAQRVPSGSPANSQPVMAPYNPAAPAAPEPIAHREKTPPPIDADSGTGLTAVAVNEQGAAMANAPSMAHMSPQQMPPQQSFPGPPQRNASAQSMPPPPPLSTMANTSAPYQHGGHRSSHPTLPTSPPAGQPQPNGHQQTQYANFPQQRQQQQGFPWSPNLPLQSPGMPDTPSAPPPYGQITPLQSPGIPPAPATAPVGGYADYNYSQQSQQPQAQSEAYNVHGQLYRPTEAEAAHGHGKTKSPPAKSSGFEDRVAKLEKGVGRFLKKLDNGI